MRLTEADLPAILDHLPFSAGIDDDAHHAAETG